VQRGVRVYKKRIAEERIDDGDIEAVVGFWVALRDALSGLPAAIVRGPSIDLDTFDEMHWLSRVVCWPFAKPLFIILSGAHREYENLMRVNTFYPYQWDRMRRRGMVFVIAIASAFGGIHCIGWSFAFPSSAEQTLWRVASVFIVSVPIILTPQVLAFSDGPGMTGASDWTISIIVGLQLFLYILSRLALLILPFSALRSLSPAAYHVVHWTSFIPHL